MITSDGQQELFGQKTLKYRKSNTRIHVTGFRIHFNEIKA